MSGEGEEPSTKQASSSKGQSSTTKSVSLHVDYAPARGKKVFCNGGCGGEIGRGHLRLREEPTSGGPARKFHLDCYTATFNAEEVVGFDKLKDEDKDRVTYKSIHPGSVNKAQEKQASPTPGTSPLKDKSPPTSSASSSTSDDNASPSDAAVGNDNIATTLSVGAVAMAKIQSNHFGKSVWFPAKILKTKPAESLFDLPQVQVNYEDYNFKEWVPENCVAPLVSKEIPPIECFQAGVEALGYRKKPGSSQAGWWYSVKVLRYLPDVPGAFVQWQNFPFPDSILEAGKIQFGSFESLQASKKSSQLGKRTAESMSEGASSSSSKEKKPKAGTSSDEEDTEHQE